MLLNEQAREALAPFSDAHRILISGILVLAYEFWQGASPYMQKRYAQYAMPWREFTEVSRKYEREVANKRAIDLEIACTFVDANIGLFGFDYDEIMDTSAQGRNLLNTATLLCVSGLPAGQGDLEMFMRRLRDVKYLCPERYRELVQPQNRAACAFVVNPLFEVTARRYAALAKKRGDDAPHAITFANERAALDRAVVNTGYLLHRSILDFLEPVRGTA